MRDRPVFRPVQPGSPSPQSLEPPTRGAPGEIKLTGVRGAQTRRRGGRTPPSWRIGPRRPGRRWAHVGASEPGGRKGEVPPGPVPRPAPRPSSPAPCAATQKGAHVPSPLSAARRFRRSSPCRPTRRRSLLSLCEPRVPDVLQPLAHHRPLRASLRCPSKLPSLRPHGGASGEGQSGRPGGSGRAGVGAPRAASSCAQLPGGHALATLSPRDAGGGCCRGHSSLELRSGLCWSPSGPRDIGVPSGHTDRGSWETAWHGDSAGAV